MPFPVLWSRMRLLAENQGSRAHLVSSPPSISVLCAFPVYETSGFMYLSIFLLFYGRKVNPDPDVLSWLQVEVLGSPDFIARADIAKFYLFILLYLGKLRLEGDDLSVCQDWHSFKTQASCHNHLCLSCSL